MLILVVDSAAGACTAAVVEDDTVRAQRHVPAARDQASILPVFVAEILQQTGLSATRFDLIAATVGPGSFTGIRGCLALAQGLSVASGVPLLGVTVGEALAEALPRLGHRALWVAIHSRRGRVFLDRPRAPGRDDRPAQVGRDIGSFRLDDLPLPGPGAAVAVAGNAAVPVAAFIAARGRDVMLTDARLPAARPIAQAALRRHRGELPPIPPEPLYIDPPEAKLPTNLRPPPL